LNNLFCFNTKIIFLFLFLSLFFPSVFLSSFLFLAKLFFFSLSLSLSLVSTLFLSLFFLLLLSFSLSLSLLFLFFYLSFVCVFHLFSFFLFVSLFICIYLSFKSSLSFSQVTYLSVSDLSLSRHTCNFHLPFSAVAVIHYISKRFVFFCFPKKVKIKKLSKCNIVLCNQCYWKQF
jgi:hypothetical protein